LINDLYVRIIYTDSFDDFEDLSIEWIKNTLEHQKMNVEGFLESIQKHPTLFSSLIGFFYQHGVGCNADEGKALEMYSLAIKQDEVQTVNKAVAKYLLSLYYYKDIILVNKISANDDSLNLHCQDETTTNPKFEQYVISARRGNAITQYNLGYCYQYGKG
jgi:hypothetical protein